MTSGFEFNLNLHIAGLGSGALSAVIGNASMIRGQCNTTTHSPLDSGMNMHTVM
jgi:hypothetical protein